MKQLQLIQAGLKVPKNNHNAFGNYKYRKAEDILAEVKPMLGGCTVTLTDDIVLVPCEEDRVVKLKIDKGRGVPPEIEYRTLHIAGRYFVKSTATISDGTEKESATGWAELDTHDGMSKEQCCGSASSYSRKIALCGLFGIDDSASDPDVIDKRPRQQQQFANPLAEVQACNTLADLAGLWNTHPEWQQNRQVAAAFTARRQQIEGRRNG